MPHTQTIRDLRGPRSEIHNTWRAASAEFILSNLSTVRNVEAILEEVGLEASLDRPTTSTGLKSEVRGRWPQLASEMWYHIDVTGEWVEGVVMNGGSGG